MDGTHTSPLHPVGHNLFAAVALALALTTSPAHSQVSVDAVVTPLGGSVRYELTIGNNTLAELALVSINDAPLGDPLISPTLSVPVGFLGSYDGGLGFVDFLADTASFAPGAMVGGFSFESLSPPGSFFQTFEAMDVLGTSYSGNIHIVQVGAVIPEAHSVFAVAVFLAAALGQVRCRRRKAQPGTSRSLTGRHPPLG